MFLAFCNLGFSAASFTASLDRNIISLGETAVLTLSIAEGSGDDVPSFPAIRNLTVTHTGQSSQIQFVNGAVSSSVAHTFEVTPSGIGSFVIPSLRMTVGGKTLASQSLTLNVVQGKTPAATEEKLAAFLKLIVPKAEIYVGEPILAEVQLYCQEARDLTMPQLQNDGFTVGPIPQPTQSRTQVSGENYNLVVFKMMVAPTKAGALTLGPATCGLKILTGPRNIFGQFTQARQITLKSEAHPIRVLPLPAEGKPPGFNGAIGNFSMEFSVGPTNV
ncbi:MAG: BatD family protein, partial [Verrucomicrobiota bacterium]